MSEAVSFKVRKEIKREMEMLKDDVNWPEELREFVELKIREVKARKNKERIKEMLKNAGWSTPKGASEALVRGDRDSH